jgi:hypothetical protein
MVSKLPIDGILITGFGISRNIPEKQYIATTLKILAILASVRGFRDGEDRR